MAKTNNETLYHGMTEAELRKKWGHPFYPDIKRNNLDEYSTPYLTKVLEALTQQEAEYQRAGRPCGDTLAATNCRYNWAAELIPYIDEELRERELEHKRNKHPQEHERNLEWEAIVRKEFGIRKTWAERNLRIANQLEAHPEGMACHQLYEALSDSVAKSISYATFRAWLKDNRCAFKLKCKDDRGHYEVVCKSGDKHENL